MNNVNETRVNNLIIMFLSRALAFILLSLLHSLYAMIVKYVIIPVFAIVWKPAVTTNERFVIGNSATRSIAIIVSNATIIPEKM
eukprot:CAMPEP_0168512320 /NCGR_PEP_ID=MMETSP0405-20121227/2702_1 /TAXON_ID=498012 /ORGANISM="Trichosphaerium sp, Strain Am-I-7 wt" /LENGTH=83 /DNA_ID=CAMNT_0008530749 /DNA_START=262 /DNA_END=513 /DNA_ORIENTATION=-